MDLVGRNALVTGASRGIGEAIARELASEEANVILAARTLDAIEELADELGGVAVPFDAADPGQVAGFIERVEADNGPVDVLFNNAGVETTDLIEDADPNNIERTIRINLITPEQLTAQVVPGMLERGRGHLVYTSSVAATAALPTASVYSSTKAGLTRFAETIRMELRYTPVGVTILHLGPVGTSMWDRAEDELTTERARARLERFGVIAVAPVEQVAKEAVAAVRRRRTEVLLPRRMAATMALNGAGTRSYEAVLRGIDFRVEGGKEPVTEAD